MIIIVVPAEVKEDMPMPMRISRTGEAPFFQASTYSSTETKTPPAKAKTGSHPMPLKPIP
ncbi:hypothetical protein D3C81_1971000 [compost metagenome]